MTEKFSLDDLLIKIIPGGTLIIFIILNSIDISKVSQIQFNKSYDFLLTFMFFILAFLAGEIIQTVIHLIERVFYVWFKFYKPSEIFLLNNNPIIKSEIAKNKAIEKLGQKVVSNINYNNLGCYLHKKELNSIQHSFNTMYAIVSQEPDIKIFNRGFLFVRGITLDFLIFSIFFCYNKETYFALISISLLLIFYWRTRGCAKKLVERVFYLYIKE